MRALRRAQDRHKRGNPSRSVIATPTGYVGPSIAILLAQHNKVVAIDKLYSIDMVRQSENGSALIGNWLRNKNTLEFLSVWEEIYNPTF